MKTGTKNAVASSSKHIEVIVCTDLFPFSTGQYIYLVLIQYLQFVS